MVVTEIITQAIPIIPNSSGDNKRVKKTETTKLISWLENLEKKSQRNELNTYKISIDVFSVYNCN